LTDLERAARFLYLQRLSFGGKVTGRTFGVDRRSPGRFDVTKLEPMLAEIHERLAGVVIEQLPYGPLIERYDAPETLIYLDPPYVNCEDDYGDGFAPADFERLADQLAGIAGNFVLSINDAPLAREVFDRFEIQEVDTSWSISTASAGGAKKVRELIITNRR
jgi:DNA adenine methylase